MFDLTYLCRHDPSPEPVSGLEHLEIFDPIPRKVRRGGESAQSAADHQEASEVLGQFEAVGGDSGGHGEKGCQGRGRERSRGQIHDGQRRTAAKVHGS